MLDNLINILTNPIMLVMVYIIAIIGGWHFYFYGPDSQIGKTRKEARRGYRWVMTRMREFNDEVFPEKSSSGRYPREEWIVGVTSALRNTVKDPKKELVGFDIGTICALYDVIAIIDADAQASLGKYFGEIDSMYIAHVFNPANLDGGNWIVSEDR